MSGKSYLGRLASRAGPNPPGLEPPRGFADALPVAPFEEQAPRTGAERAPVSSPSATRAPEPASEPVALPAPSPSALPSTRPDPVPEAPSEIAGPALVAAPRPIPARPPKLARPPADFVFDAPGHQARSPRPAGDDGARVETAAAATPPPARRETGASAPGVSPGLPAIAADPVTTALAAAIRWTSSEPAPEPPARPAEPATARSPRRDARPEPIAHRPNAARQATTAATKPPDRFADVHIGSIEVAIVPAPEERQPATPVAAPARPRPADIALARKVTSNYGLRQR